MSRAKSSERNRTELRARRRKMDGQYEEAPVRQKSKGVAAVSLPGMMIWSLEIDVPAENAVRPASPTGL